MRRRAAALLIATLTAGALVVGFAGESSASVRRAAAPLCAGKTKAKADACLTQHLRNHGYGVERDGPGHFEAQKHQPSKSKAVLAAQNLRSKGFKDAHAEREE